MTYKQIMIDNVDVSECEHVFARTRLFTEKNFVECTAFFLENEDSRCNCSDNPNCYYKQLKRKEQECEELQNKFLELNGKSYSNSLELDQLKQTLTEIKEIAEENDELLQGYHKEWANNKLILQKISEVLKDEQL